MEKLLVRLPLYPKKKKKNTNQHRESKSYNYRNRKKSNKSHFADIPFVFSSDSDSDSYETISPYEFCHHDGSSLMDKFLFLNELESRGVSIKDAELENPKNVFLHNTLDIILRLRYSGYPIFEEDFEM